MLIRNAYQYFFLKRCSSLDLHLLTPSIHHNCALIIVKITDKLAKNTSDRVTGLSCYQGTEPADQRLTPCRLPFATGWSNYFTVFSKTQLKTCEI